MFTLKIDSFLVDVTDYCKSGELLVLDVLLKDSVALQNLLHYADSHCTNATSIDYTLDGKTYHGHFGLFVYDPALHARLYMTTVADDYDSLGGSYNIFYQNVISTIRNHKKALETVIDVLTRNNLLSQDDQKKLSDLLPTSPYDEIMFYHKVDNVNDYLKITGRSLEDIRSDKS